MGMCCFDGIGSLKTAKPAMVLLAVKCEPKIDAKQTASNWVDALVDEVAGIRTSAKTAFAPQFALAG